MSDPQVLNQELYPDLVERGGLASALADLARDAGIDLGDITTGSGAAVYLSAQVTSNRGPVRVLLGVEERWFSITLAGQNHVWAEGGSPNLVDVVRVADSWRSGIGIEELATRYPFMELAPLAVAYERDEVVPAQWSRVLADPDLDVIRPLLAAVHASDVLGRMFPFVTHLTLLRLTRSPRADVQGEVWIRLRPDGFDVEETSTGVKISAVSMDEAVAAAESLT